MWGWDITLALFALAFSLYIRWAWKRTSYFKDLGIAGPKPNLFFGNILELYIKGPIECQRQWVEEHGRILGYYYGMRPILFIADPNMIKNVLIKDFSKFPDRIPVNPLANFTPKDVLSKHVINLNGKKWKEMRSILTPTFTTSKMKQMSPAITSCVDVLMSLIDEKVSSGVEFNIHDMYQALTMDVICKTAFGLESNIQKKKDRPLLRAAKVLFSADYKSLLALIGLCLPVLLPVARALQGIGLRIANKGSNPIKKTLNGCEKIIKARRHGDLKARSVDLLQLMLDSKLPESEINSITTENLIAGDSVTEAKERKDDSTKGKAMRHLTDDEVKANSFVVFLAGYETTSTTLAFTTHLLATHPEIQDNLWKEVDEIFQREGKLDFGAVNKLPYLDKVISESMRVYPPVYLFVNRITAEDAAYGDLKIPKGLQIQVPVYLMHHDPEFWSDPDVFDPERFSTKPNSDGITYLPFGAGPRNCLGMRFAQMEAKIALASIVHKFKFIPGEHTVMGKCPTSTKLVTLSPKYGIPVKAIRRRNKSIKETSL